MAQFHIHFQKYAYGEMIGEEMARNSGKRLLK
jgi:hypothetical protein